MDLIQRTQDACAQLTRYGAEVATSELADVLEALADLNDDLHHGRDDDLIHEGINQVKALLDAVAPGDASSPSIRIGHAYRLRLGPGHIANCKMHVRAIVDRHYVVVAVYSNRRGWQHRIEHLDVLRRWREEGRLTPAGKT